MDLETRIINGEMFVFCCSIFDGKDLFSFYLNDFNNDEELLIAAIKTLFKRNNFDSIFLLKILSKISLRIVPIINDNDLIDLTVKFSDKYNIKFKDSYLLLPSSLRKLAINFNVEEKEETIKYCNNDVIEFNLKIFSETRINAIKYPTLSSLAFAIYRSNFMKDEYEIKKIYGYYGGAVDVYIHKSDINQLVYRYDVNSLYPYVMKNFYMPTGNPQYFEGDIYLIKNKPFGFFEVEVESPKYLEHPILLFKTIAPLGKWKGVYFSEEIENAKKYGYKFKVLREIFMEYVDKFYDLKCNANKNDPIYIIAKLLLNSLYGKFGMSPYKDKHDIIDNKNLYKFVEKYIECDEDFSNNPNVNIAIAAAITGYARIFMSKFKNSNNFSLFYSDTDCIDIDKPLNKELIGTEIGNMKLEHVFTNIIYLAPKVYSVRNKGEAYK
ncbi:B type DNA polymerase [Lentinula aff. detonsa]|uniref:Probable DNA polymerase n=1 Tax=Lentinula aff. detonsa TaxID=2804958 RepID=A0AA38NB53_9AGAR|nr:B type DNA polymerase [Lentinula aff. detonsa]